ncbi:triacylglycerol lipase OBL1 [Citrus sinensis]|nr:triacylglycerol lipase OBL1 [Citrus sinensis]
MASTSNVDDFDSRYLIVNPENGGMVDLLKYLLLGDISSGVKFLEAEAVLVVEEAADHRWVIAVSIIARKIIGFLAKPMEYTGFVVDFTLNLLSQNGNIFGLLYSLLHGKVVIPQRGTETFLSTIGQLDGRIDLYKGQYLTEQLRYSDVGQSGIEMELVNRILMDLCIMASKLAYENAEVVRNVVVDHWKMHFVDFYNCWNDFEKEMSTQVFILTDKPKDATLILISFRGTEPFDADDWCTDFDYSWYEIPKLGKVHMGFLEALGLGNRADTVTFQNHLLGKEAKFRDRSSDSEELPSTDNDCIPPGKMELTAYYAVKNKLKSLLEEHKKAKFVVTGHSLGGALAILFPTVLVLHDEMEIMHSLLGVYTFGQPRIGNERIGRFMKAHLESPVQKYFRVVYCNDMVPSLTMGYTHGPQYEEGWFSIFARILGLAFPGISAHCPTDYVNSVRLGKERTIQMSSF